MSDAALTGLLTLLGAVVGGLSSFAAVWIQSRKQDRRERLRHAAELALADYNFRAKHTDTMAMSVFLAYQVNLMDLIERDKLTPETFRALSADHDELIDTVLAMVKERDAKAKAKKTATDRAYRILTRLPLMNSTPAAFTVR
jgi:hypothetical protein